ncbi:HU family DNA-binding protein [uncultured Desulfosarcina sp.]|uniref:HU family DNA-binding protein n=1 Tax=uncultured Desulfosarcina sp. TaxID=218289 RepID=UPI0029C65021|nr:HU family DNA-binding protein [uncultured Desulfosarcina sp.]
MNKGDLVNEIAQIVSTKKQAQEVVDTVFSAITGALKKNEPVQIAGFGSFKTAKREARTGRNPQTGAEIKIAARTVPKFVPGKALKDSLK